ncbi:sterol desaturase family protein [Nannocystis sp. ILAH1]|uniref:sterol desaturase family protein n=1 Tax=Nannocystis sp. ILAH1 TaxID=2996789 RepID=UPI002270E750|nr:sterol desaturase family protein [Nannocystis sp. ILAH1]
MFDLGTFLDWFVVLVFAHGGVTLLTVALGRAAERAPAGKQIQGDGLPEGQVAREIRANIRFCLLIPAALALALQGRWIVWGPDTVGWAVASFFLCSVVFDVYFYGLHRLLHTRPLMRFHRLHHLSRVTTPWSAQSVSTVEALGWALGYVGVPWLLGHVAPVSLIGYFVYLFYNVFGNIIGHANVELGPPALTRSPTVWFAHPYTFHALHHARFTKHFGFGSTFMDRLAGTEWADWVPAYEQVMTGKPLRHHGKTEPHA